VMVPKLEIVPKFKMLPAFDNVMVPVAKLLMVAVDAVEKMPLPSVFDIAMSPELLMVPVLTMAVPGASFDIVMVPPKSLLMVPGLVMPLPEPKF